MNQKQNASLKIAMLFICLLNVPAALNAQDLSKLKMTFTGPGVGPYQGIPIGNGRIGARIHGGVQEDLYRLNDATFWTGGPEDAKYFDVLGKRKEALLTTRNLLKGNLHDWTNIRNIEAAAKEMSANAGPISAYMPFGDLVLTFGHKASYTDYSRALDLNRAVTTVSYMVGSVRYTRETFASFPGNIIVTRLTASAGGSINVTAALRYRPEMEGHASVNTNAKNEIVMKLRAPYQSQMGSKVTLWKDGFGMAAEGRLKVINKGGKSLPINGSISVKDADEVILIYSSATSYNGPDKNPVTEGKSPASIVTEFIDKASIKSYENLYNEHLRDYQAIFGKVRFELNGNDMDPNVMAFQAKRYDMISTSRYGDRPRSAFGMWNEDFNPTSDASHYLNENLQKMYGFIETANIPQTGIPLWKYLRELSLNGAVTAAKDFGFRGWMAPHNSDIWCTTALRPGRTEWSIFPVGGMWLSNALWEHYQFSLDKDFLARQAYPILKGAAEFASDLLVERTFTSTEISGIPAGKYLVSSPSTSCENSYGLKHGEDFDPGLYQAVTIGSTQDMTIIRGLFESCIKAAQILGIDREFAASLQEKQKRLLPFQVHHGGELQEYAFEDYMSSWNREIYKHHRHASQLLGLWPYAQINSKTPELMAAARKALETRGGGNASRMPDKAAMLARLGYGDQALAILPTGTKNLVGDKWCDNLQNAVCEMVMQSHNGYIELLPALPSKWKSGKIKGLRARGNYQVDLEWNEGKLTAARIQSFSGSLPIVLVSGKPIDPLADKRIKLTGVKSR